MLDAGCSMLEKEKKGIGYIIQYPRPPRLSGSRWRAGRDQSRYSGISRGNPAAAGQLLAIPKTLAQTWDAKIR
jgi:hypothetical protein